MSLFTRAQRFVDTNVQGSLMARTALYWLLCLFNVAVFVLVWRIVTGPSRLFYTQLDELWRQFAPAIVASCILLPLVMVDMVRFSNRFAGPVHRLRKAMTRLADGDHVSPLEFRQSDFWKELAADFNRLSREVESLRKQTEMQATADCEICTGRAEKELLTNDRQPARR